MPTRKAALMLCVNAARSNCEIRAEPVRAKLQQNSAASVLSRRRCKRGRSSRKQNESKTRSLRARRSTSPARQQRHLWPLLAWLEFRARLGHQATRKPIARCVTSRCSRRLSQEAMPLIPNFSRSDHAEKGPNLAQIQDVPIWDACTRRHHNAL